jgi:secondary thiamine-phosphate synthase enzyme
MMEVYSEEIQVSTGSGINPVNITEKVQNAAKKSGISAGACFVYSMHTTAAVIVNENEPGLLKDIPAKLTHDFPKNAGWEHDRHDNNAHAHLAATYVGISKVLPVEDGKIKLGTWQSIFLLELDGPRTRSIFIQIVGVGESD